jgi:hypothetical protein
MCLSVIATKKIMKTKCKWEKVDIVYICHLSQCCLHNLWGKVKLSLPFTFPHVFFSPF